MNLACCECVGPHVQQQHPYPAIVTVAGAGPVLPAPSTPLETLRSRWQSAAEAFCAQRGLTPSLLGVVVSELQHEGEELPAGVHKFKQVQHSRLLVNNCSLLQHCILCWLSRTSTPVA